MLIKQGETRPLNVSSKKIIGFSLNAVLTSVDENPIGVSALDLKSISVKCILTRKAKNYTLFQDILPPLALSSSFRNDVFRDSININPLDVLKDGVIGLPPVKEISILRNRILFDSVVDLQGNDSIVLEVYMGSSVFAHATINSSESFVEVDYIEGVGFEYGTPYINVKNIVAGDSRIQEALGNNVTSLFFINLDKQGIKEPSQTIMTSSLSSSELSFIDNYIELLSKRSAMFPVESGFTPALRSQCFELFKGVDSFLTDCMLDLTFSSSNITSGNNYIVYRSFYSDVKMLKRGSIRASGVQKNQIERMLKR